MDLCVTAACRGALLPSRFSRGVCQESRYHHYTRAEVAGAAPTSLGLGTS